MNNKVRILQIFNGLSMGGAETWMLEVAKEIRNNQEFNSRMDMEILLTGGQRELLDKDFEDLGIKLHYAKFSLKQIFEFKRKLNELLGTKKYDVIHCHQDFVTGWILLAGIKNLPPIRIAHIHNPIETVSNYLTRPHRYISYYLGRIMTFLLATQMSGTSKKVMEDYGYYKYPFKLKNPKPLYCGINRSRFRLNKNSSKINLLKELNIKNDRTKIGLFVGRLELENTAHINQKNPDFGFSVAIELVKQYDDWIFIFVGKGADFIFKANQRLTQLGLNDRIYFLGIRNDVNTIMSACNLLIFPSLWEGLGMVSVEAQFSGLPVIASTMVPNEALVYKDLFYRMELNCSIPEWVNKIIEVERQSQTININLLDIELEKSVFNIKNSVGDLMVTYLS